MVISSVVSAGRAARGDVVTRSTREGRRRRRAHTRPGPRPPGPHRAAPPDADRSSVPERLPASGRLPAQTGCQARGAFASAGMPLSRDLPPGARHAMPPAAAVPPPPAVPAGPMFPSALPAAPVAPASASPGYGPPFRRPRRPHRCWTGQARPGGAAGPGPGYVARHHSPPGRPGRTRRRRAGSASRRRRWPPATVGARAPATRGRLARFAGRGRRAMSAAMCVFVIPVNWQISAAVRTPAQERSR